MKLHFPLSALTTGLLISVSMSAIAQETMDEIIVTGSLLSNSVDEAITGVSVLSGDNLLNRLAPTLGETLKTEPGVSSTAFGAGASRPIVRGQGGDRVRVLTNGIGSIDASSASPDHAVAAEPAQAERIEVLRGATLLRYGSSGSGGIINVIDGRIPSERPDGKLDGAVRIGASSVDQGREVSGALDYALGASLVLHLDGTFKETDDYRIPGFAESARLRAEEEASGEAPEAEAFGRLANSDVSTNSQTVGLSYIGDRGFLGVAVHKFNSDYGVPGGHGHEDGEQDEEGEAPGVTIGLDQTRFDLNGELELDGFIEKLQIFGGYADYEHTEFEAPGEPGTVFTNKGYEVRVEALQVENNGWAAAYGAQIRNRDFAAIGDEAFVPPTNTRQLGIYTFQAKEIGDLHLEVGARFENVKQENTIESSDRTFDLFSISAGGDIHLSDTVRLGGTVFRTERAPTTEELFSNGPHLATNQFERGDSTLGKEIAKGIEAAFRHRTDTHFITANIFYTDYSNYVSERGTADIEDELPVFQFTGEDATFKGFELQAGQDIATFGDFGVKVDGLAEYVRATTETGNLPRIPPFSILTGIEADSDWLNLRAELDYTTAQKDISAFETPSEDYGLVNLFATWKADFDQEVRISLSVQNLLDQEARQHTSFLKEVVPLPGRNIRFSISSRF